MRLLLLLALALPSASAAAPAPPPLHSAQLATSAGNCRSNLDLRMADRSTRPAPPAKVSKLGDEPPAASVLAVYRMVGGCPDPAILQTGIGLKP